MVDCWIVRDVRGVSAHPHRRRYPEHAYIVNALPLFATVLALFVPAGLVLSWIVSTVWLYVLFLASKRRPITLIIPGNGDDDDDGDDDPQLPTGTAAHIRSSNQTTYTPTAITATHSPTCLSSHKPRNREKQSTEAQYSRSCPRTQGSTLSGFCC
jgi:hypothetical protein